MARRAAKKSGKKAAGKKRKVAGENRRQSEGPWRHEVTDVGGIRLHHVNAGHGPLVVLLHGFPQFWYAWRRQIPVLAKRFRVVAPDLRGYGDSDKPRRVSAYTLPKLSGDIANLIRALGETKAHVVGHDWGGAIAWDLAMRHPEVVDRLAILNAPHPHKFVRTLLTSSEQRKRSWYMYFFQLPWIPEWWTLRDGARLLERAFVGMAIDKKAFTREDLDAFKNAMRKRGAMRAAVNYYRAAFRHPISSGAIGHPVPITAPTRIIWAEKDLALGKELTYGLEEYFAAPYDVRYIPKCSHWVMEEKPTEVNRLLLEFLSR